MKSKTMVYPFDNQFCSLLRHKNFMQHLSIEEVVSPNGWGMVGKDSSTADGGDLIGRNICGDFEKALDECDTVLFTDHDTEIDFNTVIYPKINRAIEKKKNIICTMNLDSKYQEAIIKSCNDRGIEVKFYNSLDAEDSYKEAFHKADELFKIEAPVVFVMGFGERSHKFHIQLALRENILNMGYKISQIGSRGYSELLGFHSFPSFMYSQSISETKKIIMFNH